MLQTIACLSAIRFVSDDLGQSQRRALEPEDPPADLPQDDHQEGELHRPDGGIPYGIALAAGALLVYPQTFWFACLAG